MSGNLDPWWGDPWVAALGGVLLGAAICVALAFLSIPGRW